MDLIIKSKYALYMLALLTGLGSCRHEQFAWKNKQKNTLQLIPEKDSILKIDGIAKSRKYGFTEENAVKVGIKNLTLASSYPEKYLKSITGPNGEELIFHRVKSCCPFKTVNSSYENVAVLEIYEVSYQGSKAPVYIYINFFDQGPVLAPQGFLPKKFQ